MNQRTHDQSNANRGCAGNACQRHTKHNREQTDQTEENGVSALLKQILIGFGKKRGLLACRLYVEGQHCVCMSARRVHRLVAQHHVDAEVGVAEQVTLQHVDCQSLT